jgi:hypothetical protein
MRLALRPARLYGGMVPTSFHLHHPTSTTIPGREDQPCELLPFGVSEQGKAPNPHIVLARRQSVFAQPQSLDYYRLTDQDLKEGLRVQRPSSQPSLIMKRI